MRLFRRVPTPFAITYLVSSLLRESVQKRKADKYAAQAVHYYKPFVSLLYVVLCPSVIITDAAPDLLTVPKNFLARPGKQKSGREP